MKFSQLKLIMTEKVIRNTRTKNQKVTIKDPATPPKDSSTPAKKPRAKKAAPTKEEVIESLDKGIAELHQIIACLKAEEQKIVSLGLESIPVLVTNTLQNLDEDMEDFIAHKAELNGSDEVV